MNCNYISAKTFQILTDIISRYSNRTVHLFNKKLLHLVLIEQSITHFNSYNLVWPSHKQAKNCEDDCIISHYYSHSYNSKLVVS